MTLTAKQEGFAQSIADGLSQADAYRTNYSAEKMADKTIWEKASHLMADGKVAARVAELRDALADKQLWTRTDSVDALKAVVAGDNYSAQVSAVKELNSMHGFNEPAKVDFDTQGLDRDCPGSR